MRLSDQIRQAVRECRMKPVAISDATGIDQAALSRFVAGKAGLGMESLDRLGELLSIRISFEAPITQEEQHVTTLPPDTILVCKSRDGEARARGHLVGDNILKVLKGSRAKGSPNRVFQRILLDEKVLAKEGPGIYVFTQDYEFGKPSPAASTVLGNQADGWERWRDEQGRTLNEMTGRNKG